MELKYQSLAAAVNCLGPSHSLHPVSLGPLFTLLKPWQRFGLFYKACKGEKNPSPFKAGDVHAFILSRWDSSKCFSLADVITSAPCRPPSTGWQKADREASLTDRKGEEDYLVFTPVITVSASSLMIKVCCSSHTDGHTNTRMDQVWQPWRHHGVDELLLKLTPHSSTYWLILFEIWVNFHRTSGVLFCYVWTSFCCILQLTSHQPTSLCQTCESVST